MQPDPVPTSRKRRIPERQILCIRLKRLFDKNFRFRTRDQNFRRHAKSKSVEFLLTQSDIEAVRPLRGGGSNSGNESIVFVRQELFGWLRTRTLSQPSTKPSRRSAVRAGRFHSARFNSSMAHDRALATVCIGHVDFGIVSGTYAPTLTEISSIRAFQRLSAFRSELPNSVSLPNRIGN